MFWSNLLDLAATPGQSLIYEWRLHQPKIPTRRRGLLTSVGRLCADLGHVSVLPSDLSYTKCVKLKIAAAAKNPKGPHRSCPQDVSIHLKFKTESLVVHILIIFQYYCINYILARLIIAMRYSPIYFEIWISFHEFFLTWHLLKIKIKWISKLNDISINNR